MRDACRCISETIIRVWLNRAKEKLREKLSEIYSEVEAFGFRLTPFNRIVENMMKRIAV